MGGSLLEEEIEEINLLLPFKILAAVETGTYKGQSAKLLSKYYSVVHTIELRPDLYEEAKKNNSDCKNIIHHRSDSVTILPEIINSLNCPTLYFLDAHLSGVDSAWDGRDNVPLLEELDVILFFQTHPSVFIFDDLRLFDDKFQWNGVNMETIKHTFERYNWIIITDHCKNDRFYVIAKPSS